MNLLKGLLTYGCFHASSPSQQSSFFVLVQRVKTSHHSCRSISCKISIFLFCLEYVRINRYPIPRVLLGKLATGSMEESWLEVADCLQVPSSFSTTRTRHPAPLTVLANGSRFLYLLDLRDRKLLVRYKSI